MKKFLVLALVMGIASLASAGLVFPTEIADGTLILGSDASISAYDLTLVVVDGDVKMSGANVVFAPDKVFDFAGAVVIDEPTNLRLSASQFFSPAVAAGELFYLGSIEGMGQIQVIDELAGGEVLGTINVVPEPATMALLGLGALVLRRKK